MANIPPRIIRNQKQQELVSGSSDYLLNVSSYLLKNTIPRQRDCLPFYIELVDQNNVPQSIPYPPVEGVNTTERVLGIRMMVNPQTISNNMAKIVSRAQTMVGWVEEHWGEDMDTISFQGKTAAFIVTDGSPERRLSASYRQFKQLVDMISTNGCSFDKFGFVSNRFFILLTYDYAKYRGYFESVDVTEDATDPFRFTYTITFKAERTIYSFIPR